IIIIHQYSLTTSTTTTPSMNNHRKHHNLWDNTPNEIKLQIYDHCDALTLFLNNLLTEDQIESIYGTKIWDAAFQMDWTGDLSILPQHHFPTTHQSLIHVHSKRLYQLLCEMKPSLTAYTNSAEVAKKKFKSWLYSINKVTWFELKEWKWNEGELEKID
ncbi:hypothetical protein HDU76_010567, partial [Blyttiomyces sp. JEL0837]